MPERWTIIHSITSDTNDITEKRGRLFVGLALEELVGSRVGSKCQSSECVHDDVDLEKLNSQQNGLLLDGRNGRNKSDNDSGDIRGDLELQEFAHGVVDAATPNNSLDD